MVRKGTKFSICLLFYGDYPELAERCLSSLNSPLGCCENLKDIRIGLNGVSKTVENYIRKWGQHCCDKLKLPCLFYKNIGRSGHFHKYPLMRRMLLDDSYELPEFVMWFDDDSFLGAECDTDWWRTLEQCLGGVDMIGQFWFSDLSCNQVNWVRHQTWAKSGRPFRNFGVFCTGGWWVMRSRVCLDYNWPCPELRHNGGDVMLGELFYYRALQMRSFDQNVSINRAARRGASEAPLGSDFVSGKELSCSHQCIEVVRTGYNVSEAAQKIEMIAEESVNVLELK